MKTNPRPSISSLKHVLSIHQNTVYPQQKRYGMNSSFQTLLYTNNIYRPRIRTKYYQNLHEIVEKIFSLERGMIHLTVFFVTLFLMILAKEAKNKKQKQIWRKDIIKVLLIQDLISNSRISRKNFRIV